MNKAKVDVAVQLLQWCGAPPGTASPPERSPHHHAFPHASWPGSSAQGGRAAPLTSFLGSVQPSRLLRQSSSSVRHKGADFLQQDDSLNGKSAFPAVLNRRPDAPRLQGDAAAKEAPLSPKKATSAIAALQRQGGSDDALLPAIAPQREAPQTWRALMPGLRDSMGAARHRRASEASAVLPAADSRDGSGGGGLSSEAQKAAHRRISEPGRGCRDGCGEGIEAAATSTAKAPVAQQHQQHQQQQQQWEGGGLLSERGGMFESSPSMTDFNEEAGTRDSRISNATATAGSSGPDAPRAMAPAPPASQSPRGSVHVSVGEEGAASGGVALRCGSKPAACHPRLRRVSGQAGQSSASTAAQGVSQTAAAAAAPASPSSESTPVPRSTAAAAVVQRAGSAPTAVPLMMFLGFPAVLRCGGGSSGSCSDSGLDEQRAGLRTPSALHGISGRLLSAGMSDVSFKDWVDV